MAIIPVRVSATISDEWGITASTDAYAQADDSQTVAVLVTSVNAFISALDAATSGQITASRVTILPALPGGVKTVPVAGSRVEQTGLLGFSSAGTNKKWSLNIPALSNATTVLSGDSMVVNVTTDPLGILIALLTTGVTLLKWANAHSQDIQAFIDALIGFHKKRKSLQRASRVV